MANAQDVPGSSAAASAAHPQVNSRYEELTRQHHSLDQAALRRRFLNNTWKNSHSKKAGHRIRSRSRRRAPLKLH
jgi:hypothetical protein